MIKPQNLILFFSLFLWAIFSSLTPLKSPVEANQPAVLTPEDWQALQSFIPGSYLKASNTDIQDYFGDAVAISGNTVVVGAYEEDSADNNPADNSAENAGAVYVFTKTNGVWSQQAYLKGSYANAHDYFGSSVAISGDTIVVGAYGEMTPLPTGRSQGGVNSGAAYVFVRQNDVWSQQAYLRASNPDAYDQFGLSVAISGDTIVVGAMGESSDATGVNNQQDNNSAPNSGAAYVFVRSGDVWHQQAYLKASNTEENDAFGYSVAVSADTIAVGAFSEDSEATGINGDQNNNLAPTAGAVYLFTRAGEVWSQQAYLKASNAEAWDMFGWAVALSENTLVVGAQNEYSQAKGVNGDQTDNSAINAGAAYVFTRHELGWSQEAYLKATNTEDDDFFGRSVAISGDTIVVGASYEESGASGVNGNQEDNSASYAGAGYVYVRHHGEWFSHAYLKASNPDVSDSFGEAVAISGETIVIGASGEDSQTTGIDGDQNNNSAFEAGAVYTFETIHFTHWAYLPIISRP